MPGGSSGGRGFLLLGVAIVAIWLASGFYTVAAERGRPQPGVRPLYRQDDLGPELQLALSDRQRHEARRSRTATPSTSASVPREDCATHVPTRLDDVPEESLMLTGDENIADVKFRVIWQIDPVHPEDYAFNLRNPHETVKAVAESAMREVVGRIADPADPDRRPQVRSSRPRRSSSRSVLERLQGGRAGPAGAVAVGRSARSR